MNFEKRNFDCLVNFPIDIVWKGEGEKKVLFLFFWLSIWHIATEKEKNVSYQSQFVPSLEVANYSKKESHFVPKSIRT